MGSIYTLVPRPIYDFAGLPALHRYAFGLLYDRWLLSCRAENISRFRDAYGVYCVFDQRAMAAEMGVTLPTVRKALESLRRRSLIISRRGGMGEPVRYYVTLRAWDFVNNYSEDGLVWWPFPEGMANETVHDPKPQEAIDRLRDQALKITAELDRIAQDVEGLADDLEDV